MLPKIRKSMLNDDGSIKKFSSTRENLLYHYLPSALQVTLPSASTIYMTGLYTSTSASALTIAAGVGVVGAAYSMTGLIYRLSEKRYLKNERENNHIFDFNKNKNYSDYKQTLDSANELGITETFIETLHGLSKKAGLHEVPLVMYAKDSFFDLQVRASAITFGEKKALYINDSFLTSLSDKEQKGVLAHEIAHLADNHTQKQYIGYASKVALAASLIGFGIAGTLTLLPTSLMAVSTFATKAIGGAAVAGLAYATLETIKNKYKEFIADRGVTLLSDGDTSDYQSGLEKANNEESMLFGKKQKLSFTQKAALTVKNETLHYISGTHPKIQVRMDFVKASEKQYHELKEKMDTQKRAKPRAPKPSQKM